MIDVQNLHKSFNGRPVLRGVNLTIHQGETLVIIGRSGCGKSVLFKHMVGLMKPDSGHIYLDGQDIPRLKHRDLFRIRLRFGMLFQNSALFDSMTVAENVMLGLLENRMMPRAQALERARECLCLVGLEHVEEMKPADLSGGMRKRVSLARSIAMKPEIMCYDEPTTGLDPIMSAVINELICDLQRKLKITSLVVTHDMNSAYHVADRIVMLHQGAVVFDGSPEQVKSTDNAIVRQFIEGRADQQTTNCAGRTK